MEYEFGLTPSRMGLTFNISGFGFGFKMGLGFVLAQTFGLMIRAMGLCWGNRLVGYGL